MAMLLGAAACSDGSTEAAVTTPPPAAATTAVTAPPATAGPLVVFGLQEVRIGDALWTVAVADEPEEHARGLMGVTDLGGIDGMLFTFRVDVEGSFWMKDTLIPLDIAFFSSSGDLIEVISMVPCDADPCPVYGPGTPYRYAVEAEPGRFGDGGDLVLVP